MAIGSIPWGNALPADMPPMSEDVRQGIAYYLISVAAALTSVQESESDAQRRARLLREEADAVEMGGGKVLSFTCYRMQRKSRVKKGECKL